MNCSTVKIKQTGTPLSHPNSVSRTSAPRGISVGTMMAKKTIMDAKFKRIGIILAPVGLMAPGAMGIGAKIERKLATMQKIKYMVRTWGNRAKNKSKGMG